jgi:hypothetical protein
VTEPGPPAPAGQAPSPDRPLLVLTGVVSLLLAIIAAVWLLVPATSLLADQSESFNAALTPLNGLVGPIATATILLITGLLGAGVALVMLVRGARGLPAGAVIAFGLAEAALIGFGLLNESAIMFAGYLMALAVVVGGVLLVVQLVRKSRIGRWVALAVIAAIAAVFVTGLLPAEALVVLAGRLSGLTGRLGMIGTVFALVSMTLLWLLVAVRVARLHGALDRPAGWVLRHRRVITILAAAGPLPYCVLRLTWLTPWPYGMGEELTPDIRIWGLLLSSGGWVGLVLTLGLICRWGEIFPRWMPFLSGRPAPIWAAAGPGSFIAAILIVSAAPMFRSFATEGLSSGLFSLVIFPFWFWGPMLALAVWGYVLHRRSASDEVTPAADTAPVS